MAKLGSATVKSIENSKKHGISAGSSWHRWDPHIHCPGTVLNNQFRGEDPWEDFLTNIENSEPRIKALGITDYYRLNLYEEVLKKKALGRLPGVELIFPNVELRFQIETAKKSAVNFHLLFSPDDPNHVGEIKRFLNNLTYEAYDDVFHCNDDDLIKLGRCHKPDCEGDRQALEEGVNQFKVNLNDLKEHSKKSGWFQDNAFIAVAAGSRDGTSGLQEDSSFASTRAEIEKLADIIFSSNPGTIEFWSGNSAMDEKQLIERLGGKKPCLHGSDAHDNDNVGKPDQERNTWIKGNVSFEALKQTVIEPTSRVFIGTEPPIETMPSYTMSSIEIQDAPWIKTPFIPLNSGLVTIIGARGSGKTALADIIAVAAGSDVLKVNKASFVSRANELLNDEKAILEWGNEESSENKLSDFEALGLFDESKVQYLSQQFVEELCSAEGITDELMSEIERVIFHSHHPSDLMGTSSFSDLVEVKSSGIISLRQSHEQKIKDYASELDDLREKRVQLPDWKKLLEASRKTIEDDKKNRQALLGKSKDQKSKNRHTLISQACDTIRIKLDAVSKRNASLVALKENVQLMSNSSFSDQLRKMQTKYADTQLNQEQWNAFELGFKGNVEQILTDEIAKAENDVKELTGEDVAVPTDENLSTPLIPENNDLGQQTYKTLRAELRRLEKIIGLNEENVLKITKLSQKITREEQTYKKLEDDIKDAEQAGERINDLRQKRRDAYKGVFQALLKHEEILTELYKPLMDSLKNETGSLGKLTFNVQRVVDVKKWALTGEQYLDLRKTGDFRGQDALQKIVEQKLLSVWESGTADEIADAMAQFLTSHEKSLRVHCKYEKTDKGNYRQWIKNISEWLYSTDHISINYGVQYDGVNIQQLSPGTRGIVLLLLYLAIDKTDYRPLIIDQPEENLDPKSIFDELVPVFKSAKLKRQIIVVTHNANLVVNTDAEQVIVASCGPHKKDKLPEITYLSGGLEDKEVREKVCEILEGGEKAFQERAKRLRVNFR